MVLLPLLLACSGTPEPSSTNPSDTTTGSESGADDGASDAGDDVTGDDDGAAETDSGGIEDDELPDDYTYEAEDIEPDLATADVELALIEAMGAVVGEDPFLAFDAYNDAISAGDGDCPYYYDYYYEYYGYDYWYGPCTTDDDTEFSSGYIYGVDYGTDYSSGYYDYTRYAWQYGDLGVIYDDGSSFDMSGYFYGYGYEYTYYGYTYFSTSFVGEVYSTQSQWADTWIGQNYSLDLAMYGGWDPDDGSYITLSGGVSGFEGVADAVWFDDVFIASSGQGSDCPSEPSGTISVRGSDGEWYEVEFQGPSYAGGSTFPADCDGCGDIWFRGQNIGQVCPDFAGLTEWEVYPWQ